MITDDNSSCLRAALATKRVLLADGATGTNLFELGLQTGDSPELWNTDHPDRVTTLYNGFINAGSDLILTNSFGGTRYRLGLHAAEDRVHELNAAAARIAREAVTASGRDVLVAGSMGPTGEILQPNGPLSIDDAAAAFAEQAAALRDGGADVLWIETLSSREEIEAAVIGAETVGLPIVVTVSIDTNGRTMMGLTANDLAQTAAEVPQAINAIGTNCGVGAAEVVAAIVNLSTATQGEKVKPIIVAKANCGIPEYVEGKIVYNGTPEIMAEYARLAIDAGADIIGGCCGTSPAHVAAMRSAIDAHQKQATMPAADAIVASLGEVSKGALAQLQGDMSLAGGSASGRGSRRSRRGKRPQAT